MRIAAQPTDMPDLLPLCIILQANFAGDAQYKQHVEGPIHRKALAKAEAQRQRDLQLGASKGAAESALVRKYTVCHHIGL